MSFNIAPDNLFINAPFRHLEDGLLDMFIKNGLQPEIGLEGDFLYTRKPADYEIIARRLQEHSLSCTLHAPFFDLAPGALDPNILEATRHKMSLAFALIDIFKPKAIICHLNFEDNKHGYKLQEWARHAEVTWRQLLRLAEAGQCKLMLENTYEKNPEQHINMLTALNSPSAGFCLDTGHLLAFAHTPWQDWLPTMNKWLGHMHLHDNHGQRDEHLGIGLGDFDFKGLFKFLGANNLCPTVTLEPHSEEDLMASLEALKDMGVTG
jgi:sugar phosphate isomerase/epimerase